VTLAAVLDYVAQATGLIIRVKSNVDVNCTVDWDHQTLNSEEAPVLLKQALNQKGYTAIPRGRMLTILRSQDVIVCHPLQVEHKPA
jgi:hypothetical protein